MSTDPEIEFKGNCGTCKTPVTTEQPRFKIGDTYYHNLDPCMNNKVLRDLKFKGLCGTCSAPVLGSQHRNLIGETYYHDPDSAYPCVSLQKCKEAIIRAMGSAE